MKKILFDQEVDFSKKNIEINFPGLGDIDIETTVLNGRIYAKFTRFTPGASVEFTIEEDLTGIRAQYIMFDRLVRKTDSVRPKPISPIQKLSSDIDELIKISEKKEEAMLSAKDRNYTELAIESARRNGYLDCKLLIYKYL